MNSFVSTFFLLVIHRFFQFFLKIKLRTQGLASELAAAGERERSQVEEVSLYTLTHTHTDTHTHTRTH